MGNYKYKLGKYKLYVNPARVWTIIDSRIYKNSQVGVSPAHT